jgi:hypothetical protein
MFGLSEVKRIGQGKKKLRGVGDYLFLLKIPGKELG